jgi:hypothetical protein
MRDEGEQDRQDSRSNVTSRIFVNKNKNRLIFFARQLHHIYYYEILFSKIALLLIKAPWDRILINILI